jgi:transcriptional regulator with XRE-family HTH domain
MSEENWAARLCRAVDEKLGGNWSELARRADLTPSTLQQAKEGGDVRLSTLIKIAEALGMTVGELLGEPGIRAGEEPGFYKKDDMGVGALSRDEGVLVKKYRHLKPGDRTRAQEIIHVLDSMKGAGKQVRKK